MAQTSLAKVLNLRKAEDSSTSQMKGGHNLLPRATEPIEGFTGFGRPFDPQLDALLLQALLRFRQDPHQARLSSAHHQHLWFLLNDLPQVGGA
jgi:hypothetical protein